MSALKAGPPPELILYGFPVSANAYRVKLVLHHLAIEHVERLVDLSTGGHRAPEYLAINPLGQVPALRHGSLTLWDSHAIVVYLAEITPGRAAAAAWPNDAGERAAIARWLFFDANELHNGVGIARNVFAFGAALDGAAALNRARGALQVMERRLSGRRWLEFDRPTVADLACYPLLSVADEARLDLDDYPAVRAWMRNVEALNPPPPPSLRAFRAANQPAASAS